MRKHGLGCGFEQFTIFQLNCLEFVGCVHQLKKEHIFQLFCLEFVGCLYQLKKKDIFHLNCLEFVGVLQPTEKVMKLGLRICYFSSRLLPGCTPESKPSCPGELPLLFNISGHPDRNSATLILRKKLDEAPKLSRMSRNF